MNIVIIAEVNFPEGMAATAHVSLMAKGLIENGASVILIIPSKSFNGKDKSLSKVEGVFNTIKFKFFNKYNGESNKFSYRNLLNAYSVATFLKKRKRNGINDIVITYCNDFLKYHSIFLTCFFNKIPLFPWEVEKRISTKETNSLRLKIQKIGYIMSDLLLPKLSNGFIVISTLLKTYYTSRMKEKNILISPILVDENDSREMIKLDDDNIIKKNIHLKKKNYKLIVYSGSFGEKDGFPYILEAFKILLKTHPNSFLATTGKPSKYNPIEEILHTIKQMGLSNNFHYFGLVTRNELKYINQNADLLLVCRSNSQFANHGFPWKLGEYLMTKNPILATRVGDIERYLTDKKEIFIAEPENIISIYETMKIIFDDYENACKVAINGFNKAIEVFDYKSRTFELKNFIENRSF